MKGMYLSSNYNRWMPDTTGKAKTPHATCSTLHHPSQPSAPLLEGQGSYIQPEQHILSAVKCLKHPRHLFQQTAPVS